MKLRSHRDLLHPPLYTVRTEKEAPALLLFVPIFHDNQIRYKRIGVNKSTKRVKRGRRGDLRILVTAHNMTSFQA